MMKWNAHTETTNIGVLELGDLSFNEKYIEIAIDICDMSDNLKAELEKAIEIAKVQYSKDTEELNIKKGLHLPTVWSNKPVVINFTYLYILLEAGKPITYQICVAFTDAENKLMEQWNCSITVDLSEYTNELKKAIIKALVDKFF